MAKRSTSKRESNRRPEVVLRLADALRDFRATQRPPEASRGISSSGGNRTREGVVPSSLLPGLSGGGHIFGNVPRPIFKITNSTATANTMPSAISTCHPIPLARPSHTPPGREFQLRVNDAVTVIELGRTAKSENRRRVVVVR